MLEHLAEFSPPLFKTVGEEQIRKVIRFGRDRADHYGFTLRGPVRFYLELMLLFGSHFDTDPQYPWAAEILTRQNSDPQMQRAERLYKRTLDYQEKVAGPEDAYALRALRNISVLARQPLALSSENFIAAMRQEIVRVYPQKAVRRAWFIAVFLVLFLRYCLAKMLFLHPISTLTRGCFG